MGGGETVGPECQAVRDAASDYLDGHVGADGRHSLERHLDGCPSCELFLDELRATLGFLAELREASVSDQDIAGVARVFDEYSPEPSTVEGRTDWTSVKQLWGQLADLLPDRRAQAIRAQRKYVSPHLCDWLIGRARRASTVIPDRAVHFAESALHIARELRAESDDPRRLILALDALAWCLVVLREFPPASAVLRELAGLCEDQGVGSEEKARYLVTKGVYLSHTGSFEEADCCLRHAMELRQDTGGRIDLLCALVNAAGAALSAGEPRRALQLCDEAEGLLDGEADPPRLQTALYSNLVLARCEVGLTEEARQVLPTIGQLASTAGGWYPRIYAGWLEGTVSLAEGRYDEAASIFEGVRHAFLERGHLVWYLEASLDLSRAHLQLGRLEELNALASELLLKTNQPGIHERVRSAVVRFAQAVRQRSLSSHLVRSIALALSSVRLGQRP